MALNLYSSTAVADCIPLSQVPCSRRSLCRGAAVGALSLLAGCSGIMEGLSGSQPDLVVFNKQDTDITASIEVSNRSTEETVLSDSAEINSGSAAEFPDVLPSSGEFTMTVETTDGLASTHEWSISSEDQSMQVRVRSNSIEFDQLSP